MVDVELVDLAHRGRPNAYRHGASSDQRREPLPLRRGERLGIADARDSVAIRAHDHGRGDDRATGWCDPNLVNAHDPGAPVTPEAALEAKRRDDGNHRSLG